MLVAYFFFSDALLTSTNNFPLYLEQIHGAPDTFKALLTVAILGLAAVGAPIFGWLADKFGHKRILMSVLAAYCLIFPALAFVPALPILVPIFLLAGFLFGHVWGISRALVGKLAPAGLTASSFSYYVVAEKFATLVGPVLWSSALLFAGENAAGYQIAFLLMTAILFISVILLARVEEPQSR